MEGILAIIVGWVVVAAITGVFKNSDKNKDNHGKSGDLFTDNYTNEIVRDTAKNDNVIKQKEQPKKDSGNWIYIILAVIATLIIFGLANNFIGQKQQSDKAKQMTNDINYCRSVAAQYGQQGTDAFNNAYYVCVNEKDW